MFVRIVYSREPHGKEVDNYREAGVLRGSHRDKRI